MTDVNYNHDQDEGQSDHDEHLLNESNPIVQSQYSVKMRVSQKDFKGSTGGIDIGLWTINVDRPEDFKDKVWSLAKPFIHRGVDVRPDPTNPSNIICEWMNLELNIDDIDKFLVLESEASKRPIIWSEINGQKLHLWRNKNIKLTIYKFSNKLTNKNHFTIFC